MRPEVPVPQLLSCAAPAPGAARASPSPAWPRRRWLSGAALGLVLPPWLLGGCAGVARPGPAPNAGALPVPLALPPLDARQRYHLVNRLSWGANDAEMARLQALGASAYARQQLEAAGPAPLPAPVQAQVAALQISRQTPAELLAALDAERDRGAAQPTVEARDAAQKAYQRGLTGLANEAAARHLWQAVHSPNQLQAQLTWFWFNHFNVHQYKGTVRAMLGDYEARAIQPHVLGRFRDLLGAVTVHPAMLVYLDNTLNAARRLNENHARELLELHTLGVDGGYSQADVQAMARVLTGHGLAARGGPPKLKPEWQPLLREDGLYQFNPARHDFDDKALLGTVVRGQGAAELDQVLDLLARHPATARHLSRQLARYFLGDAVPPALVERMAQAYLRHDGHIGATLAVLVSAPEFVAESVAGFVTSAPAPFKDPMHFVVSAVRAAYGDDQPVLNTAPMRSWLNRLGQGLYNRLTPDGYPLDAEAWTGSGQLATRFEIARAIGSGNAGLFKADDVALAPVRERAGFPQLARPLYYQVLQGLMAPATRTALANAGSPQDWNTLLLASPEFMVR